MELCADSCAHVMLTARLRIILLSIRNIAGHGLDFAFALRDGTSLLDVCQCVGVLCFVLLFIGRNFGD